jgi:phage terminase large subunit-like protein
MSDSKTFNLTEKQSQALDLVTKYKYVLLFGGSRSGKTAFLLICIIIRALKTKSRHAILRYRFNHAKISLWYDSIPKILEIAFPGIEYHQNKTDWFIQFGNGSEIWIGGLDDKERTEKILGNEYSTIYFNECSQISYDSITTALTRLAERTTLENRVFFDNNPPSRKHWSHKMFIEYIEPETSEPLDKELYASLLMNPHDNIDNISEDYIKNVLEKLPLRKRKRFLSGLWGDDNDKALWKSEWIDNNRIYDIPDLSRIVVAIDPAVSSNPDSNEHGIIIAGEAKNEKDNQYHYYVLDDESLIGTPQEWANTSIAAFHKFNADRIIAEKNNGGDMVMSTLKNVNNNIPVSLVWASKGKFTRAEPISALYEQGRVHHTAIFDLLEDELTDWNPEESKYSPNRLDALVWAITNLANLSSNSEIYVGIA